MRAMVDREADPTAQTSNRDLAVAASGVDPLLDEKGFESASKVFRHVALQGRAISRVRQQRDNDAFVRWCDDVGDAANEKLVAACPHVAPFAPSLQVVPPTSGFDMFEVAFDVSKKASRIAAFVTEKARVSRMARVIDRDWCHKTRLIQHADQLPITTSSKSVSSNCFKRGLCTCTDKGKKQHTLRNTVFRHIKTLCPRGSENRRLLQEAFLVLRVTGSMPERSAWSIWAAGGGGDEDDVDGDACKHEGTFWLHMGYVHLSPYRVAFQWLDRLPEESATPFLWLKASHAYGTDLHLATRLSIDSTWTLQVYELVDSLQPIGTFDPSVVPVRALGREEPVWPPKRKTHSRTGAVLGAHPDDHRADHDNHMDDDGSGASSSDGGSASESVVSDEDGVDAPSEEDLGDFAFLLAQAAAARDAPPNEEEDEEKLSDASSVNSDDCHSVCTEDVPVPDDVHRTPTDYSAPDSPEDVPPVPPPAEREEGAVPGDADDPMVAAAPVNGNRIWAVEVVLFPGGGRIAYYRNNKFVAYCANRELHGHQCRLTRIARGKRPGAGRPLGELKAWIDASFDFESGADHCRKCNFPTRDRQLDVRRGLEADKSAQCLFPYERQLAPGEHD